MGEVDEGGLGVVWPWSVQVEVWVSGAHLEIVAEFVAFWADIWMSPPRISFFIIKHLSS